MLLLFGVAAGCGGAKSTKPPYQLAPDPVEALVSSPQAGVLVAAYNQKLRIWEPKAGKELSSFEGHGSRIISMALSPDGQRVATGDYARVIKVWDAKSGKELLKLTGHRAPIKTLAFSADGKRLASGAGDPNPFLGRDNAPETDNVRTELKVWDLDAGKLLIDLKGHGSPINGVGFLPDGMLLSTGMDGGLRVFDVATGKVIRSADKRPSLKAMALSPDGKLVALALLDNSVQLWDVDSWKEKGVLIGHEDRVNALAFDLPNNLLATGSDDKTVMIWDLTSLKPKTTLKGHANSVTAVAFGGENGGVISGGSDAAIRIWDLGKSEAVRTLK